MSTSLRADLTERELVEVAVLVGTYFLIARLTTVFEVPSDPPADHRLLALAHHHEVAGPAPSPEPHEADHSPSPRAVRGDEARRSIPVTRIREGGHQQSSRSGPAPGIGEAT